MATDKSRTRTTYSRDFKLKAAKLALSKKNDKDALRFIATQLELSGTQLLKGWRDEYEKLGEKAFPGTKAKKDYKPDAKLAKELEALKGMAQKEED